MLLSSAVLGQSVQSPKISYKRPLFDFDFKKPLFKLDHETKRNYNGLLRFSAITGYKEGVESTKGTCNFESVVDKDNHTARTYMLNLSIEEMLTMGFYKERDVILDVKDVSKYRYPGSEISELIWKRKNAHCFELMMPYGSINDIAQKIVDELSHFFGVRCNVEKRVVDVLVLVRTSSRDKIQSTGTQQSQFNSQSGLFKNTSLDSLSVSLNQAKMPRMINATGYTKNVDLNLKNPSWKDINAVRKELLRYDLDLRSEKRTIDMFVIKEKDYFSEDVKQKTK
jgi:hypothetical protein